MEKSSVMLFLSLVFASFLVAGVKTGSEAMNSTADNILLIGSSITFALGIGFYFPIKQNEEKIEKDKEEAGKKENQI